MKRGTLILCAQLIALLVFVIIFIKFGSDKINPEQVFAYSRDLSAGDKIAEEDLIVVPISSMTKTIDMFTVADAANVVGKRVSTDVYTNNIVYAAQLTDIDESGSEVILQDLSNKVLYSMPVDYTEGVAGNLKAGDRIDLMFTHTGSVSDGENENSFTYSKIFMREIMIYNINTGDGYKFVDHSEIYEAEIETASDTNNMLELTSSEPTSITLILTPEQAEQLSARRAVGNVKLLKRFDETQTHETLGFVIGNYGKIFSGNANAETANLQIVDSYTDDDPNKRDSVNTNQGSLGTSEDGSQGNGRPGSTGNNNAQSGAQGGQVSGIATGTTTVG